MRTLLITKLEKKLKWIVDQTLLLCWNSYSFSSFCNKCTNGVFSQNFTDCHNYKHSQSSTNSYRLPSLAILYIIYPCHMCIII